MDLSKLPDYRRHLSNQDADRREKVSNTRSKRLDTTFVKSGSSLFATRKVGPLYRKYCDTDNCDVVYGSKNIEFGNSKKVTHSESSFSEIWQDGVKQLGIRKPNLKMASRPEIRVLNESYVTSAIVEDDLPSSSKSLFGTKSNGMEKVGQVSVALPPAGSSTVAASWKNYHMGIANPATEHNGNAFVENHATSNHKNAFDNENSHPETGTREISMKLNMALKKYDGLDKLREKIKRQQLASKENKKPENSNENEVIAPADDQYCADGNNANSSPAMMEEEPHTPVRKVSYHCGQHIADDEENERRVKVRKISTSVPSPSYKGFTDLKGKPRNKSSNAISKLKPKLKETNVESKINDKILTSSSSTTTTITSDKCDSKTNVSEPVNDKNKSRRKDLITPSSWREGQEIIRRVLGPPPKIPAAKPKSFIDNPEEINLEESKLTVGARQMLKDLQLKNLEANNVTSLAEEIDTVPPEPKLDSKLKVKPFPHAVKRKPTKVTEPDKQAKVRHYNSEEVRKFIAKKKDERLQKAKEDKMAMVNRCMKRQEMLQEVYRKQREATAAQRRDGSSSRFKSSNDCTKSDFKDRPAFDVDLSGGGSSDLHLSFSDDSSTLTTNSHDSSTHQITSHAESSPAVLPMKSSSFNGRIPATRTYPRPMNQNLEQNFSSWKTKHPTVAVSSIDLLSSVPKSDPASYLGQIELSNRRRIMDIHSSAATLTNKLREIYRQTSVADSMPQTEECYSPSVDILSGTGPTYVGTPLDNDLPGVQSLRLKAQEIYEKKEQDAATRIQAVYRGYTVRKNLKWQYLTGLPDIEDQATSGFQTNSYQEQSDNTSFVNCGLAVNSPDFGKTPKFKSLFHQYLTDQQRDSQNHASYTNDIKEHKYQPRSSTLYPKCPWKDTTSDQFSIVNIFTSKYKDLIKTDSDHSSDAVEKHIAKLHSPAVSPIGSNGSNKTLASQLSVNLPKHNYTGLPSNLGKPVKADICLEEKKNDISIQSGKKDEALSDAEVLAYAPSETVSSHFDATRSKSSHKSGNQRGMSARKKLILFKASSKSVNADSHTDTSLQSFSEDSEIDNRSTSEAPLQSQSTLGDSTDSDVSSLLNDQTKTSANHSYSRLSSYSHPRGKDTAGPNMASKRYAPSTLPMRLRAELYNFEQTVETVSLAQQETFSLGQIFQNHQQKQDQELHYWDRLKHAVNLLDGKTSGPTSQIPEHSEALMSGDQSFSLKSITAHEGKNTLAKHQAESLSTQTHASKVVPSTMEILSNSDISESSYSHSHVKHSNSAAGKYSPTSTSQTESKRRSHRKNLHHSSHHESQHSDESSSSNSRCSVKTASDVRVGEEMSDSITEDISDGSIIEASSVSMSASKQSRHSSKQRISKEAWKVQLEEEKHRAQKEDAIWQNKLKEVQEKLNSLQHPLIKKELDEVLPELVKRKLVVLEEVPRMMAELQELTDKQEALRKEHYKKVKSLLKYQANSESRNRDSSKSDSEIYGHSKRTKGRGSSPEHGSMSDMYVSKQKCLAEKKLEIQALEKRLQHEEKYLHKLKKETLKKCNEPHANSSSSSIKGSIKEDLSEHRDRHNSRRCLDNYSHSSDHSISEALNATTTSLPASFTTGLSKGHYLVSGGKSSISEDIQDQFSRTSNNSKLQKQYACVNETSIAEDINSQTRKDNSSYSKKIKPSASESGDDTATNDEYSRSFETSISSSYRASPVRQLPRPLVGARNGSLSFKSSRSSRCRLRGSESDTEDSFQSETLSDASDIEVRIRALSEDLRKKKIEADRLRHEKKAKYREKLEAQEESLIKQIEAYDNYIKQIKEELQKEHDTSSKKGVKPQIKQPKVSESRKFKQRSTTDISPAQMSKRDSTGSSADETLPTSPLSPVKHEFQPEISICSGTMSPRFPATNKSDISKQSSPPLASHLVQQSSPNEVPHTSTTDIKTKSIPEELDEKTISSPRSVSISGLSKMTNKEAPSSSKEVLNSAKVDSLADLASRTSSQPNTETTKVSKENENQVDSGHLPTDKSVHLGTPLSEISESISEKIESMASSSALSKTSDNDKTILKLNLNEENSYQLANAESETKQSEDSVKAKDKLGDSTSFSEQYSEDFEVDKTVSSQPSQSFGELEDDDKSKDEEMSQYSLDKTISEVEQEDEISEQLSVHSDTSARTSPSKSLILSNSPRGVPDGQFDISATPLHASPVSLTLEQNVSKESTDKLIDSELQENLEGLSSVSIEPQPLVDSGDDVLNSTSKQIENVVDEILNKFVSESVSTICKIAAGKKETMSSVKKAAPAVLPKPKRKTSPDQSQSVTLPVTVAEENDNEKYESATILTSAVLTESKPLTEPEETKDDKYKRIKQQLTNELMESLLAESIKNVLDVRQRKIDNTKPVSLVQSPQKIIIDEKKITTRKSSSFEVPAFSLDDDPFLWSLSPDSESSDDFPQADSDEFDKNIPRPHSPLPNEPKPLLLSDDVAENIWSDLVPYKPPPPYPGHDADPNLELQKLSKEFYAVPQKREKINQLVSSAVEAFWQDRLNGCSLNDTTMPDCFLTVSDDLVSEMDQASCRSYKKMLFDLTKEIIEEVYQGDDSQSNDGNNNNHHPAKNYSSHPMVKLVHRKCHPVINKYYRQSRTPPSSPEELQKVVKDAVAGLLQVDNSDTGLGCRLGRMQEFDKWKTSKKDHVDRILIQELQEEESQWVDYDADVYELKVQLVNTIFDSLITKTVETFKNIYNKRNQRRQQLQQAV